MASILETKQAALCEHSLPESIQPATKYFRSDPPEAFQDLRRTYVVVYENGNFSIPMGSITEAAELFQASMETALSFRGSRALLAGWSKRHDRASG